MAAQISFLTPDLANRRYPDIENRITEEWVAKFFKAADYEEWPRDDLPHSFYSCLREGEFRIFADLGVELRQLLHVSQWLRYYKHLRLHDTIVSKVNIEKIHTRKLGGEMVAFVELHNRYFREGELIGEAGGSCIVREVDS